MNLDRVFKYIEEKASPANTWIHTQKRPITLFLEQSVKFNALIDYKARFNKGIEAAKDMWDGIQESRKFIKEQAPTQWPGWKLMVKELPLTHPSKDYVCYIDAAFHNPKLDQWLFVEVKTGEWARRMEEDNYQQIKQHQELIDLIWPGLKYKIRVVYLLDGQPELELSPEDLLKLLPNKWMVYNVRDKKVIQMKGRGYE